MLNLKGLSILLKIIEVILLSWLYIMMFGVLQEFHQLDKGGLLLSLIAIRVIWVISSTIKIEVLTCLKSFHR